jgi:hypothetical protein
MTTRAQLGDRVAVGQSWRPKEQQVGEVAHRWRWERWPTLSAGGYLWAGGQLRINGDLYQWESGQESDGDGRRSVHVSLTKVSDGTMHNVEVGPSGQAVCQCQHKAAHPALTCRHEACVPAAVGAFDTELSGRLDRAAGMAETPELDFEF